MVLMDVAKNLMSEEDTANISEEVKTFVTDNGYKIGIYNGKTSKILSDEELISNNLTIKTHFIRASSFIDSTLGTKLVSKTLKVTDGAREDRPYSLYLYDAHWFMNTGHVGCLRGSIFTESDYDCEYEL